MQAVYFALMLISAWPSRDGASLPRKFLSVLFLDVFGDAAYDPTEAEQAPLDYGEGKSVDQEMWIARAEKSLELAHAALRRWEAIPPELLSPNQSEQLEQQRSEYFFWRDRLHGHIAKQKLHRGVVYDPSLRDHQELRGWANLSAQEKREDHYADSLIGPLTKRRGFGQGAYYYHLESNKHIFTPEERHVVSLNDVAHQCEEVKEHVRHIFAASKDASDEDDEDEDEDDADDDDDVSPVIAGEQKRERLPWKTIRRLTSLLQIGWVFLGVQLALQDAGWMDISFMYGGTDDFDWRRRLASQKAQPELLIAEKVEAIWPHAGFFRPVALSCVPLPGHTDRLLIAGPYSVYESTVSLASSASLQMAPMPRASLPVGTAVLCKRLEVDLENASDSPECMLGLLTEGGLAVWQFGDARSSATILPVEGQPWKSMTGSVLRCDRLGYQAAPAEDQAFWCLVLAGWDGERIPVAVVPLGVGSGEKFAIAAGAAVRPRFDVPLELGPPSAALDVPPALHLDPGTGRLLALLRGHGKATELQAWDLAGEQRSLGRRQLPASLAGDDSDFDAVACCMATSGGLLLAGISGEERMPQLLRLKSAGFF